MLMVCSLSVLGSCMSHSLLVAVLMYGSETMIWKEERSRIKAVEMKNLRGLLGIRMDKVPNARIRELCSDEGLMKVFSSGKWCMIGVNSLWGNAWGVAWGDEPLTLKRCHSYGLQRLYEALEGWKSVCVQDQNL